MTGPYAHTRNPLYLGSFILGVGVTLAGGQWVFGVALLAFYVVVYRATVLREATELEAHFGERYRGLCGRGALGATADHPLPRGAFRIAAGRLCPSTLHAEP